MKIDYFDRLFIFGLILLLILLSYLNGNIPFVYDDLGQIIQNPNIREVFNLTNFFNDPLRPNRVIQNFTFAINWAMSGEAHWSYHYFNNILHFFNTLLLFFLIPKIGLKNKFVTYTCCLIFFIHPLQVEGVTYVMARVELLKTLSTFILLHLYLRPKRNKFLIYIVLSVSLLVKETCCLTPLLFIAFDLTVLRDDPRRARYKEHLFYLSHILWVIPMTFLIAITPYKGTTGFDLFPFYDYAITNIHYLSYYFYLFLYSSDQSLYHEWVARPPFYSVLFGVLSYSFMLYFIIVKHRKYPIESWFIILFLISFLPNNSILQFINPFAEYRLYQSNMTLAFFVATFIYSLKTHFKLKKMIAATFLLYLAFFHYLYLSTWKNPLTIWGYAVSAYPSSFMANLGIGWEYINQRLCGHGLYHMHKACDSNTKSVFRFKCNYGLGMIYIYMGEKEKGFKYLRTLQKDPEHVNHYLQYKIYLQMAQELKHKSEFEEILVQAKKHFPHIFINTSYSPDMDPENLSNMCMDKKKEKLIMEQEKI